MSKTKKIPDTLLKIAIAFVIAVLLSFIASPSISPLYGGFEASNFTYDGFLFHYEAVAILEGKAPYLDFYDHKGLFHLGINVIAILINKEYGLLLLDILFGTVSIYFFLKTINLISNSKTAKAIGLIVYLCVRLIGGTGNTIGIWLTPFISLVYFFYVKAIKEKKHALFLWGSLTLGLTAAFAFNSRAMDMVYVWGGVVYLFISLIKEKKWIPLFENLAMVAFSFISVSLIFIVVAEKNGYLGPMIQAMIFDNLSYAKGNQGNFIIDQYFMKGICVIFVAALIALFILNKKKDEIKELNLFIFITGLFAFLPLIFLIKFFSHFLAAIPLIGLAVTFAIDTLNQKRMAVRKSLLGVSSLTLVLLLLTPLIYFTVGLGDFSYSRNDLDRKALDSFIVIEDRVNDNVFVIDCSCEVYLYLGVTTSCPYYCNQSWWSFDKENVWEDSMNYIKESKPSYLVIWKDSVAKMDQEVMNDYSLLSDGASRFDIYKRN